MIYKELERKIWHIVTIYFDRSENVIYTKMERDSDSHKWMAKNEMLIFRC